MSKEDIIEDFKRTTILPILKKEFRQEEFIGRITDIVYFLPFSQPEVADLVERELNSLRELGGSNLNVELSWEEEVVQFISSGFNSNHRA